MIKFSIAELKTNPHLERAFVSITGMSSYEATRCEYSPGEHCASIVGEGCRNEAVVRVGSRGQWRLCSSCAALPEFRKFHSRGALTL